MNERRQRLYRVEAIVLRRTDVGEADRLLTVLTAERGKLHLLAKGVRKTLSRKAGHVELFTHSTFLVAKGRIWDIVAQADTIESYLPLRQDLLRTTYAHYVAELVDRLTGEADESKSLFDLLRVTLSRLSEGDDPYLAVRFFELHLLSWAGYQPQLFFCARCQTSLEPVINNYFSFEDGGALCPRCGEGVAQVEPLPLNTLKVLRFLQTHEYDMARRLRLSPGLRAEMERLLYRYIVYVLERNLKSVDFLWTLRRQMGWVA
ncbi:MAG: DNA repair protein RecO [Anaerolineae bacterium]|nr:DNA repair protein RecO [Anaerolineae bacterium]MDW8099373.1 DNA repair protein RecO [Anaerolineae bacterium]